tara:strand:- start:290 stop:493 length:204 start_codon:yes stop_codon:yes gene_type:complete
MDEFRCTAIIKSGKKKGQRCHHEAHVGYAPMVCLKHKRNSTYHPAIWLAYKNGDIDRKEAMRRTKNE